MYLVSAVEMRKLDHETISSFKLPGRILMENAGRGTSEILMRQFPDVKTGSVAIVAGRGNNGGDGFVIARYLAQEAIPVSVYLLAQQESIQGDAAANLQLLPELKIPVVEILADDDFSKHEFEMHRHTLWVDAILGTGLNTDVRGVYRKCIEFINQSGKPVLSVDIPSGLNSDTGQPCGVCVKSHTTVTFAFAKCGHYLYPGASFTGNIKIVDIGIPPHIVDNNKPKQYLLTKDTVRDYWIPRIPEAHKGTAGHLLVIAGSTGKTGAAAMTATSALRIGSGLVTLGVPESLNPVLEGKVLEAMTHPLPETSEGQFDKASCDKVMALLSDKKCLAIGPGIGTGEGSKKLVYHILRESTCPMVIDADGLNLLAEQKQLLKSAKCPVVLTPHPGEMARLTGKTIKDIQKDRIECTRAFSQTYNVHLVLKGAGTIIAHPNGRIYVNSTGNPGMASGGMGDVLTGLIAGLITQGYTPETACRMAVFLHGSAADSLYEIRGPVGFLASEVMNRIPEEIGLLLADTFE